MKQKNRPLAGAADLQRKLTRLVQAEAQGEPDTTSAAPVKAQNDPARGQGRKRKGHPKPLAKRARVPSKAHRVGRPARIESLLAEGKIEEATHFVLQALAEEDAGSRHVQVKMPAWLHRDWSVYVALQGLEVREVLLRVILEKLAEAFREGLVS